MDNSTIKTIKQYGKPKMACFPKQKKNVNINSQLLSIIQFCNLRLKVYSVFRIQDQQESHHIYDS